MSNTIVRLNETVRIVVIENEVYSEVIDFREYASGMVMGVNVPADVYMGWAVQLDDKSIAGGAVWYPVRKEDDSLELTSFISGNSYRIPPRLFGAPYFRLMFYSDETGTPTNLGGEAIIAITLKS